MGRRIHIVAMVFASLMLSALGPAVCAQDDPAIAALRERNLDEAERLLRGQIDEQKGGFVPHYNLACVLAQRGDVAGGAAALRRAVELGFSDFEQMQRDGWLEPIRDHGTYRALVEHWGEIVRVQRETRVEHARTWMRGRLTTATVEPLRLELVSQHKQASTDAAAHELAMLGNYAERVFGFRGGIEEADPEAWVVIAMPTSRDFQRWANAKFGAAARGSFTRVGGVYEHDRKRLVAQDLGATLRHEFFHVLHHRDMSARGQRHPMWIQEGLASLVEDYDIEGGFSNDPVADGAAISLAPSWRSNIVKRLGGARKLKPLRVLAEQPVSAFANSRPLAQYAQVRTVFLYLDHLDLLGEWYDLYTTDETHGYEADPTGLSAIEALTGLELDEFEAAYLAWVREELPEVPEDADDLDAVLGIDLSMGQGDGMEVKGLPPGARRRVGLKLGDVITSIDGEPVRDMGELVRRLDGREPGDTVRLGYRRAILTGESEATLIEPPPHPLERRNRPQAPPVGFR